MATAARLRGSGLVIAVESMPRRRELARLYGADVVVDYTRGSRCRPHRGADGRRRGRHRHGGTRAPLAFQQGRTKPGGSISNVGYHGHGEYLQIPRLDWGVGMAEKTVKTGLCPGRWIRLERLLQLLAPGGSPRPR